MKNIAFHKILVQPNSVAQGSSVFWFVLNQQIMTKQFLTINKQFLQEDSYQQLYQNSLSLNKKYNDLCDLLKKIFKSLSESDLEVPTPRVSIGLMEAKKQFRFVRELIKFIRCFTDVSKEMSEYQISCFESLKEGNVPELDVAFQILQKVRENKQLYESIESKKTVLIESYAEVKRKYQKFEKNIVKPSFYYQPELVDRKEEELKEEMNKSWKLMSDILAKREEAHQNIQSFEPYLSTYRKKLVKNKYSVLKKLVFLIKNTKNATIEIFVALRGCAIERKQHYMGVIADKEDDVTHLSDYLKRKMVESSSHIQHSNQENKKWEKYTGQCVRQFQEAFEEIDLVLSQLASHFNHYCDTCSQQHELFRSITVQISEYFHEQESPYPMLKELLDLQAFLGQKFQHVVLKMQQIRNKLRFERNNCKKQADILLTMIKINKNSYLSTMENLNRDQELLALIEKISFQTSKNIIVSLYDEFIDFENDLLNKFGSEKHRKKQVFDSMDISHTVREPPTADKKVPLKQEYWLWKEWRAQIQINFENYNHFFKDIDRLIEKVKTHTSCKESTGIQVYNCVLVAEKQEIKGKLEVKVNSLDFTSREVRLRLPWKQIESIQKEDKMFKDFLVVSTLKGSLKFFQLQNLQSALQSLKDLHEKGLMCNKKKIQRKPEVILSAEEILQIDKRKQQIQQRLPSLKDYMPVVDRVLEGGRIDQIYEMFYSDKPFSFYGKEEANFFSYTGKKGGSYNWETQRYDQPGPCFYSGDNDVSFNNCPLFSSRKTSFNHPMKTSGIPFMPEFCLNSDVQKVYWISHEQFLYTIESNTEGVPYADYFVVFLAHRVRKVQEGVKIEVFIYIKWVKDTIMKGTVQGNIIPEVKEKKEQTLAEMQKVLKLMRSLELGEDLEIQQEDTQQKVAKIEPPNELSKLKQYNRFLLFGFIGLVVVNVLLLIFF